MKKLAKNDQGFSHLIIIVLVIVVIGTVGALVWTASKKNTSTQTVTGKIASVAPEKQKAVTDTPNKPACTSTAPVAATIDNIQASITSGNTAALEGYMAASVYVVYVGAMGSGAQTPTQAVTSITSFITSDTTSWDYNFSLPAATLSSYAKSANYSKYFPSNAVVGKATNNQVISFSFDCNGKISAVLLALDEKEI